MKNFMLSLCIFSGAIISSYSQEATYGLTAGVNYAMGGQVTGKSSGGIYTDDTFNATGKPGFQAGPFLEMNFHDFFLKTEVVYSYHRTEFAFPKKASTYAVKKINVPILIGFNVYDSFGVFFGPAYSHMLSATLEGKEFTEKEPVQIFGEDIQNQTTPINIQIGARYDFRRFGLDIRYEHNLSSAEPEHIDIYHDAPGYYGINRATVDDARLSQIILSVTYKIGGPGVNRRRGGWSYRR